MIYNIMNINNSIYFEYIDNDSYTVIDSFNCSSAREAAIQAYIRYHATNNINNQEDCLIILRQNNKLYAYTCYRMELDPPMDITVTNDITGEVSTHTCYTRNKAIKVLIPDDVMKLIITKINEKNHNIINQL